jgi:hypothetical protein
VLNGKDQSLVAGAIMTIEAERNFPAIDNNRNCGHKSVSPAQNRSTTRHSPSNRCSVPGPKKFCVHVEESVQVPTDEFPFKPEMTHEADLCHVSCGAFFWDIGGSNTCNANTDTFPHWLGYAYEHKKGISCRPPSNTLLTGSIWVTVNEVEVFESND